MSQIFISLFPLLALILGGYLLHHKKILADGGSLIIASHMGRPKKNPDAKYSLKAILAHVSKLLGVDVKFAADCMGEETAQMAAALKPGEALLLENLRFYAEEEGKPRGEFADDAEKDAAKKVVKESQKKFTATLASYADCYVNDAFGTAHRAHASTALIAKYFDADNKMFGYLMEKEVLAVEKIMTETARPFTAIMGGSKVSSKIEIIENLLTKVDNLIIAGGVLEHPAIVQPEHQARVAEGEVMLQIDVVLIKAEPALPGIRS